MGTTSKNSSKTAHVMGLIGKGHAPDRDVRVLPEGQARDIEVITSEILEAKRVGGEAILTIGRGLMEAKAQLSHGEWLPWLEDRVEISERVAQNFMRLARNYSNPNTLSDLGASKALMLLALPEEARDEFISVPHLVDGEEKSVVDMTARELQSALKERDEARKAAEQAKAEQSAAEQARERMAQDVAVANERIAELNTEVEQRSAKAREAQEAAVRLEKELEDLRSRPVEVAVQADEAAVEAARKEAEMGMQTQLSKAWEAQSKAEKAQEAAEKARAKVQRELERAKAEAEQAQKSAENARSAAQRELEQAQAELKLLREQAERMSKKTALAASEDLVLFRTLFDQVQEQVNKLGGVLLKLRLRDPEAAGKLSQALLALSERIKGVAQG